MRALILCLGTAAALAVGVPRAEAQATARERARSALPAEIFSGLEAVADEARRDGLPVDPLYNKALEGFAKRVPQDRLLPAVRTYSGRLFEAREALGSDATPPLLVAGADALQRGLRSETLRGLGRDGSRSPMAVLVLTDLVEAGVEADRALDIVREAMQRRMGDARMLEMTARVRAMLREGRSPQEAADRIRRAMRGRGGSMVPPVPPGAEPVTRGRRSPRSGGA